MVQLVEGLNVAERFRLIRELGRGGMGAVWLAEHTSLEVMCAIKFIDREGQNSVEARQRFQREAKAAAQLRSPHVVQILDHGTWENIPYIAMEYLEGEDLAHRLERVKRLSGSDTYRICTHVSRALTRAHAAGIVHRDLKPENIFLVRDDDNEIAKVLDFGIAKRFRTAIAAEGGAGTKTGSLLGTPFYMSPEQARGTRGVDYRSDLFSLATIVYQCMTGELPFFSEGLGDVLAQIMYEPMPIPSQRAPGMPAGFDAWWMRASARDPDGRFQSAKELTEGLATVLRISDPVDIPTLLLSTNTDGIPVDFQDDRPQNQRSIPTEPGLRTIAEGTTGEPLSRTFDLVPASRRRTGIIVAGVAAALSLVAGLLVWRMGSASSTTSTAVAASPPAVTAPAAADPSPALPIGAVGADPQLAANEKASPAMPASAAPAPSLPALRPSTLAGPGGPGGPGALVAPKHPKAPPPKAAPSTPASGSRHDYGI